MPITLNIIDDSKTKSKKCKNYIKTVEQAVTRKNIDMYKLGETKEIELEGIGKFKVRIANTSTPWERKTEKFSQTTSGVVIEFVDVITNIGGYPTSSLYQYIQENIKIYIMHFL